MTIKPIPRDHDVAFSLQRSSFPWALVPTKELSRAKTRLAPLLGPMQRRELVLAMLRDVLTMLCAAPNLAGVAVVSRDPQVHELCAELGALVLHDTSSELNASLVQGTAQLAARGTEAVLVVPGDVPLITPGDIAALADSLRAGAALALAPARQGGGTNALGLCIPSPVTFQFGIDSFALHMAQARRHNLAVRVYRSPTISLDIDTPEDLRSLEALPGAPATHAVLDELCWQRCAA